MRNINNSDNRINVDSRNYSTIARFRQEDDATLVVNLYKNGSEFDVSNQTITLRALRLDGQSVNQTDNITKNKNVVTINLRRNILNVIGRCSIQLNISDASGQFTTTEFFIEIEKNNLGSDALKASDNVQALQQILIDFKAEKSSLIKNITDDYNSLKKIIISQNQAADLQNQINQNKQQSVENTSRIEQLEDLTPVWQEHSGTGNITVNDSFDGFTKDLVVKGKTLKNIYDPKHCSGGTLDENSFRTFTLTSNPGWHTVGLQTDASKFKPLYKENTMYTIIAEIVENTLTGTGELFRINENSPTRILNSTIKLPNNFTGVFIAKVRTKSDFSGITHGIYPCLTSYCTSGTIKIRFMIIEGDLSEDEIPSTYFDSITSSGEQEDNRILLKSIGQNINPGLYETGTINLDTGQNMVSSTTFRSVGYIKVNENLKYYINNRMVIYFYDKNKKFINGQIISSDNFLTPSSCGFIRIRSFVDDNTTDFSKIKFMISEGVKATNYEQFRSKLIEIPLPFQKGLKSTLDGSVYDEINGNTGEIIQRVSDEYTALSKPVTHKINDIQLATFDETTHITQENNILSDISFKAKVSLSSQAKRLTEENKTLKEENRELREDTNTIVDSLISVFEPMMLPDNDAGGEKNIILEKLYAIKNR